MRTENLRGLPCNIAPDEKLWYIAGGHRDENGNWGGGILEWCFDELDAKDEFERLSSDETGQYDSLTFGKYL